LVETVHIIITVLFRSALKQATTTFSAPNTFNYVDTKNF